MVGSESTSPRADPGKGSGNFLRAARFKKSRQARPNFLSLGRRLVHSRSCGTTGQATVQSTFGRGVRAAAALVSRAAAPRHAGKGHPLFRGGPRATAAFIPSPFLSRKRGPRSFPRLAGRLPPTPHSGWPTPRGCTPEGGHARDFLVWGPGRSSPAQSRRPSWLRRYRRCRGAQLSAGCSLIAADLEPSRVRMPRGRVPSPAAKHRNRPPQVRRGAGVPRAPALSPPLLR